MNTKLTSPITSRESSVAPYSNRTQQKRNGCLSYGTPSKKVHLLAKTDSTDTFEMQILAQQRKTFEAFRELEQLVPNGVSGRASIVEMNSLIQDQDYTITEIPKDKYCKLTSNFNHS
jgi:hypothetical protein